MSDPIKHECGVALVRLRKPLSYYQEKYGSVFYGLKKLYLLMEKQHNRGQDGAGVATIKLDPQPGRRYISRYRSNAKNPTQDIFEYIYGRLNNNLPAEKAKDSQWMKHNLPFLGELLLGHLRYGTHGGNSIENCHPFLRQNNWMSRNLVLAGNFNLTNVDELFEQLIQLGQHPKQKSDNVTMLEKIGHFLDDENQLLFDRFKSEGHDNNTISNLIADNLKPENVLRRAVKNIDGGYIFCGLIGHGDAFVLRDPNGIRPCHYYYDDEIVVVTSERPAIQTAFNVMYEEIHELPPGQAIIIKKDGAIYFEQIQEAREQQSCSFERIYFSRGNDRDIYQERKKLGYLLSSQVRAAIGNDFDNTVFSYIPNTAATAFYGMIDGCYDYLDQHKREQIVALGANITPEAIDRIMSTRVRREKIALKDTKLRTFITSDDTRDDTVALVYDVTYGIVQDYKDTLVVIDDSIVRGTTLKTSILRILDRLRPKKIIIVSSAPQIRYPDCYGIDMSKLGEFVAFQALVALLKENGKASLLQDVYEQCKLEIKKPKPEQKNLVKQLYDLYSEAEITKKISEIVTPEDIHAEVQVIYQSLEDLHKASPNHKGDWYFSGNYPTPGGYHVVNKSFINYMEGRNERAY